MKQRAQQGFTLVEILIVVAIIGLLAVIGIPYVLNAYSNSQTRVKARNVAEVEKAKRVLTLPPQAIAGAMGLEDVSLSIQEDPAARSNLCAALRIETFDELTVGGDAIAVGTLEQKAAYDAGSTTP